MCQFVSDTQLSDAFGMLEGRDVTWAYEVGPGDPYEVQHSQM